MNRISFSSAVLFAALFLSGCAAGPKFSGLDPVPPGKAQIYFLREAKMFGAAMSFDIVVDGARIGTLANGGYIPLTVTPGRHTLSAQTSLIVSTAERRTEVNVAEGARSFVLVTLRNRAEGQRTYWSFGFDEANDEYANRLLTNLSRSTSKE